MRRTGKRVNNLAALGFTAAAETAFAAVARGGLDLVRVHDLAMSCQDLAVAAGENSSTLLSKLCDAHAASLERMLAGDVELCGDGDSLRAVFHVCGVSIAVSITPSGMSNLSKRDFLSAVLDAAKRVGVGDAA